MKPISPLIVVTLLLTTRILQSLGDQNQHVSECSKESSLVYEEKGDVTVTVLLDLTQGPQCNQKNAASMQSMNGILQTFQTLNSIQYLKDLKIGIRIFDTCGQESIALQAVLETALEANLTHGYSCRVGVYLGFLFPVRSYPSAVQLLSVLNLPATDISYWQTTSPLDAVSDLLVRLRWSSIAVISQSKQALLSFSKKAGERSICIVAQTVLSPINSRTKEMSVRAVRRSKRSGSKVYLLIGSSEFLLAVLPYFQANSTTGSHYKYVLVAADNWNSNFTEEVAAIAQEAFIIRPQRVLTDDNVSARVLYSLIKQFKNHLSSTCSDKINACDFEPHHLIKKTTLAEEDLRILKLSTDISIYNELFPVTYVSKKSGKGPQTIVEVGNIHEDKFIPTRNMDVVREEITECKDCLCTNVDSSSGFIFQLSTELHIIIIGSISILGILLTLTGTMFIFHIQCCSNHEDRSGNFIFLLLVAILLLFLVSFLYLFVPSNVLCLGRVIALSGAYTFFLASIFSTAATSLVGTRPDDKSARLCIQMLLFVLAISVQAPVLTYETLFRDDTLQINKILTDYGPKTECILDDLLSLKLFLYPTLLHGMVSLGSLIVIYHHWHVSAIKINLSVSSLICLLINITWSVLYFQIGNEWRDVIILAGIQGNAFVILFGVVLPKIVMGLQNLHHSFPPKTWQVAGNASDPDDQANPSPTPPPIRPNQQHIYAIPSEYDRRSSDSDYDNRNTVM
ncbi:uncharacterized protein LOC116916942 isoform X1 [Daphnia magna]|uniref:uncharacterized protein LOC116916942 isoform X1 n=1 Tax=Daphnia magna TaxID=35525 RepID=UPI001E1BD571|nr:uncharacterized protein LOC116916942 isoform X1 [Daphnia magna]